MYPFRHSSRHLILLHLVVSYRTNQPHYVCMVHTLNITKLRFLASSLSSLGQRKEAFSGSWSDKRTRNEEVADRPTTDPQRLCAIDTPFQIREGGREVTPKPERFPRPSPPNKRSRLLKKSEKKIFSFSTSFGVVVSSQLTFIFHLTSDQPTQLIPSSNRAGSTSTQLIQNVYDCCSFWLHRQRWKSSRGGT